MPLREYLCETCGFRSERIEWTPNPDAPTCPRDGQPMQKVQFSRTSFQLEGEGWSKDGYQIAGPLRQGPKGEK